MTGPVEGHINHLKLIKRQADGRAALSYLQHRFLPAAGLHFICHLLTPWKF